MSEHREDPAIVYILERIRDVSKRLEDGIAILEKRAEAAAANTIHLRTAQEDIEKIYALLLGEGIDRPGLQQRYQEILPRLESLEAAADELDGTARLSRLERDIDNLKSALAAQGNMSLEDRKGEWQLKVETHKGKILLVIAVVTGILASSFLGQFFRWVIDKIK